MVGATNRGTWGQLLIVFATSLSTMVAMLNFAPLLPLMREEFGLTNAMAGLLVSATLFSHTALQLPGGDVADRIGARRATGLGLVVAGISAIACGIAPNFPLLLAGRFALGVGTAISFISGLACVNGLVLPEKRPLAQGLYGACANLGVLVVLLTSERVSAWTGWRWAFAAEGAMILGIAWLLVDRLRLDGRLYQSALEPWSETLRQGPLYLLGLAHVLTYGVFTTLATWMATFLWQEHGIGLEWAGPLAAFLPASAVVARTLGGALSLGRERQTILVSCLAAAIGTAAMPLLPGSFLTLLDLLLLGWLLAMPFGSVFSYMSLVSGRHSSARGLSVINFVGNIGAFAFPPLVGYALDLTGSFDLGFGVIGLMGLLGSATLALWLPRPRR